MSDLIKYQVVAFDLDGTVTESREPIDSQMTGLLSSLAKKIQIVIISGSSFKNMLAQLDLFLKNTDKEIFKNVLLMPTNGSQTYLYSMSEEKWKLSDLTPMPTEMREHVIKVLKEVISSGSYNIPAIGVGKQIDDRETEVSLAALGVDASLDEKKLWDPTTEKRKKIVAHIDPLLPETDIFIAGTTTIDIVPKGVNKGEMLERMTNKRGLEKSDLLFVGDALYEGGNDYEVKREGFATIKTTGPNETANIITKLLE